MGHDSSVREKQNLVLFFELKDRDCSSFQSLSGVRKAGAMETMRPYPLLGDPRESVP